MTTQKVLFRIASILMIVGGAANIISGIIGMIGGITLAHWGYGKAGLIIVGFIITILAAIYQLIVGIQGSKNVPTPGIGAKLFVPGIIVLVAQFIGFLLAAIGAGSGAGSIIVSVLFGLGCPIFFIITCVLRKKAE